MKSSIKNTLLILLSLVVTIFLLEISVKILSPQNLIYMNNDIWRPDSLFGWRHHENAETKVNPAGGGIVNFFTDTDGYRISKNNLTNNLRIDYRVAVFGDSMIEGLQVENKNTVPEVLRSKLKKNNDINVKFYNSAVGGWGPNHYLLEAKKLLKEKKIDLGLIFIYTANDIIKEEVNYFEPVEIGKSAHIRIPKNLSFNELKHSLLRPINDYLKVRSHLYLLLKYRLRVILKRLGLSADYFSDVFLLKNSNSFYGWDKTIKVFSKINNIFKTNEIPCYFILIPAVYQCNEKILNNYIKSFNIDMSQVDLEQPNKIFSEEFEMLGINLLDPLNFMKIQTKNGKELFGKKDIHLNSYGHKILSDFIYEHVEKELIN